jgi:hypothetical protein
VSKEWEPGGPSPGIALLGSLYSVVVPGSGKFAGHWKRVG